MANPDFFKFAFDEFSNDGFLGDSEGDFAYAYLRVSSAGQGEEGRTGLPRQIMNVHKAALDAGYKVSWDMIYADDDTGFEFQSRPQLLNLRKEFKSRSRRAAAVIIENIDRLSRNSQWHQGFLLDEMEKHRMEVVFHKKYSSNIERAVMGAIAQQGMEQTLERLKEANIIKALRGCVTAKTPAFGYHLVDRYGNEGELAKKDTHYGIYEPEAKIVEYIYNRVAVDGISLNALANELNEIFSPPGKYKFWGAKIITKIIQNAAYKGEFWSNRSYKEKVWVPYEDERLGSQGRFVIKQIMRPKEEWILVAVPPIVSEELWNAANRILEKNRTMSTRNSKYPFLLTGLIKCADCGKTFTGINSPNDKNGSVWQQYRCSIRGRSEAERISSGCAQHGIKCQILDDSVWKILYEVMLKPHILIDALDRQYKGEENEQITKQIKYLKDQIRNKEVQDERVNNAYLAGAYTPEEFKGMRDRIAVEKQELERELSKVTRQVMTLEQYQDKKNSILVMCERAKRSGISLDSPFDYKRRTIKSIVDKIVLNVNEGTFRLEGIITGTFPLLNIDIDENGDIVCTPGPKNTHNIGLYMEFSFHANKVLATSLYFS